ncbi:MAG: VWA domain-containing protein [Silicimonas sp.]|nr:VWA domain-containing protein [Silicimonas sp.]
MRTKWNKTAPESFRRDESGSLVIFSLFMFILILMISGMAVDLIRHERHRVKLQNTIDTAVVASSSLNQSAETQAEVEALVHSHMAKAGFSADMVTVQSETKKPGNVDRIASRWVNAQANFQMNTMFMNMLGIESLPGGAASGAREGNEMIEIALVLDTSGSMAGTKMTRLKTEAKKFVTTILNNNLHDRTLISIIPYSRQVHMDADLMARLNLPMSTTAALKFNTSPLALDPAPVNPNAIAVYSPGNTSTNCLRFRDEDFRTRNLVSGTVAELSGHFAKGSYDNLNQPGNWDFWCRPDPTIHRPMMLFSNDELALHGHIDSLIARGWTAIDYGMNWGVGVLTPQFQDVVTGMVGDGLAPASAAGFPVAPGTPDVKKYVVLMTDGINTHQHDLKDEYKSGPTRIWHSETLANGNFFDGFIVEIHKNGPNARWYRPRSSGTTNDDHYLHEDALPTDAVQWDYHQLYERFSVRAAAKYFFRNSDWAAYDAHRYAIIDEDDLGYSHADRRLLDICAQARTGDQIEIYTIAFQAPEAAEQVLADCSARDNRHYDVEGDDIGKAFNAIATEITKLRLTQ